MTECCYCGRVVVQTREGWADIDAIGDDEVWRYVCDAHDSFVAEHVPGMLGVTA